MSTRERPQVREGSQTVTTPQNSSSQDEDERAASPSGVLRLRGGGNTRHVVWTDETVDNEGMGKKKSKSASDYKFAQKQLTVFPCSLLHIP